MSRSRPHPFALAALALALALASCGGNDAPGPPKGPTPSPTPAGIDQAAVNALQLGTPRPAVEQQFGPPLTDLEDRVTPKIRRREPKRTVCTYYAVKGGKPNDFFQFCYQRGKLASKLSLITTKKGATAPVVPPVS